MAAMKGGTHSFSFFRSAARVLLSIRKAAVHKPGKLTRVLYTSITSLVVSGGLCAVPFKQVDHLSHDSIIRRAASLATDSSSTFLSQTTFALIDAITEYSKAVHTLISLQRQYLASLGKLTPTEEDSIWQVIIGQRAQVNVRRDECKHFESIWVSAVRLCEMAAEAAYTSGAEHASVIVSSNIQVAQSQVEEAQKLSVDAEKKLSQTKVMEIERMAVSSDNNEEEVQEAYLRED